MRSNTKQKKYDIMYMDLAERLGLMSYANRRKVGALIVCENDLVFHGWNGMPSGMDNCCEVDNVTKPEVIHAEENAFRKMDKTSQSAIGATIYCTLSPCTKCAEKIAKRGVSRVVYKELYRDDSGVKYLEKHKNNIKVEQL